MLGEEFCTYTLLASRNHVNSSCRSYIQVKMPEGKSLCQESKEIVNQVFNYFSKMEKGCADRGALNRPSKATCSWVLWRCTLVEYYVCIGNPKRAVKRIRRETSEGGPYFAPPAKWYKVSRWWLLVHNFDREAVTCTSCTRRRKTRLSKLLVTRLRVKTLFQALLKATMDHGIVALCIFTLYGYSLCCCFASWFVDIEVHCLLMFHWKCLQI